jgi:hypothetical protein
MATPLVDSRTTVQVGAAAGPGATVLLVAATASGFRGQCLVDVQVGAAAGGLVAVTFADVVSPADAMSSGSVSQGRDTLQVGDFSGPLFRPVAVAMLPVPSVGVALVPVAVMDGSGHMVGFRLLVTGALSAVPHHFAWAVV